MFKKRLHVFKAGTQVSAQGVERDFSPKDLQEVVESYDPKTHEAPLVIGHSGDNDSAPSYGWIEKFVRKGDNLYADVNFTDTAKDLVKDGHYRKVSISFYSPASPINPHKGMWSARHLALLGASPPAVKGLEPFSFSEKNGVFDFATTLSPDTIFDKELGPTMIIEQSPLELLKERLDTLRGEIDSSLEELKKNQEQQTETDVSAEANAPTSGGAAAEAAGQSFAERGKKKKIGVEGTEVSESSQKIANLETMSPDDQYIEGVKRKAAKGAHGQEVQVVQEVFEESAEGISRKKAQGAHGHEVQVVEEVFEEGAHSNIDRKKAKGAHGHEVQVVEEVFKEEAKGKKKPEMMDSEGDEEAMEEEETEAFGEGVSHKTAKDGKVSFGYHAEKEEDFAGRGVTGRAKDDSYGRRQSVGKGEDDTRAETADDAGAEDADRKTGAEDASQDESRETLAKAMAEDAGDAKSRWADQPEAKAMAEDSDQYDDSGKSLPDRQKPGVSDGEEPHGRDGGPTNVPVKSEEEPDNLEMAVDLESVKGSRVARVLHKKSGDEREPLEGGPIPTGATEAEYAEEIGDKTAAHGKASFGHHPEAHPEDPTGREITGKSSEVEAGREAKGSAPEEDREGVTSDSEQDTDRKNTASDGEQDADRERVAKAEAEDRLEDQPEAEAKQTNADQFDDSIEAGISDGSDARGRDGGPTEFPTLVEEEPATNEIAVDLTNVKDEGETVRVVYQKSGDGRAPIKGATIEHTESEFEGEALMEDHAEGEADGLTREPKKAAVSDGKDARGRDGGPTEFPTKSEEEPDNLEMAVDLEDATKSEKVRIVRQKAGDAPTLDHKEKAKTPMTKTGKGSTYGQKTPYLTEEDEVEVDEFSMGSLGQAKPMGYPDAVFKELQELKAENDRLRKEHEQQQVRARKNKIAEFVEGLYVSGKLTDGVIPQRELQNYCEGLEFGTLEFAEGESPISTLFTLLDRLPNMVYYGEVVSNAEYKDPEDDDLDPHERAMKMVANGEASDYVEAIKMCIPWGSRG